MLNNHEQLDLLSIVILSFINISLKIFILLNY